MIRKLIAISILLVVLLGVTGCTLLENNISNEAEASDKVLEVSATMDDISGTLEEVDSDLG